MAVWLDLVNHDERSDEEDSPIGIAGFAGITGTSGQLMVQAAGCNGDRVAFLGGTGCPGLGKFSDRRREPYDAESHSFSR